MNLAIRYRADGNVYTTESDIHFTSTDKFNDIVDDEKVKTATDWLKHHFNSIS